MLSFDSIRESWWLHTLTNVVRELVFILVHLPLLVFFIFFHFFSLCLYLFHVLCFVLSLWSFSILCFHPFNLFLSRMTYPYLRGTWWVGRGRGRSMRWRNLAFLFFMFTTIHVVMTIAWEIAARIGWDSGLGLGIFFIVFWWTTTEGDHVAKENYNCKDTRAQHNTLYIIKTQRFDTKIVTFLY